VSDPEFKPFDLQALRAEQHSDSRSSINPPGTRQPVVAFKLQKQVNAALGFLVHNAVNLKIDPATMILDGDYARFLKTVLWAYSWVENFREDERFRLMCGTTHVTGDVGCKNWCQRQFRQWPPVASNEIWRRPDKLKE
jgi:hypothetical protein